MLSNYSRHLYDRTAQKMDFLPLLDGSIFSWQYGCIKPEETIYRYLFSEYNIDPARAVFLDDNIDNVKKSRELGMRAILFTGYETAGIRWNAARSPDASWVRQGLQIFLKRFTLFKRLLEILLPVRLFFCKISI